MFPRKLKRYSTVGLNRKQWLQLRNQVGGRDPSDPYIRFGGSDMGIIMTLHDFVSRGAFFSELVGVKTPRDQRMNPPMLRGINTEEAIVKGWWEYFDPRYPDINNLTSNYMNDRRVRKAQRAHSIIVNPDYPYLMADIDYNARAQLGMKKRIIEVKNMMHSALEKWENDLPPYYTVQAQDYMLVCEYEECEAFVLKDTTYPVWFPFEYDKGLVEKILGYAENFAELVLECRRKLAENTDPNKVWDIVHEIMPEEPPTPAYTRFLKDIYNPDSDARAYDMPKEMAPIVARFDIVRKNVKAAETEKKQLEAQIRKYFVELKAWKFRFYDTAITWKKNLYIPDNFNKIYESYVSNNP